MSQSVISWLFAGGQSAKCQKVIKVVILHRSCPSVKNNPGFPLLPQHSLPSVIIWAFYLDLSNLPVILPVTRFCNPVIPSEEQ